MELSCERFLGYGQAASERVKKISALLFGTRTYKNSCVN